MAGPKDKKSSLGRAKASAKGSDITDPRFANFQTDPRYRLPSKRNTHVKLDKRFSHMLRDPEFSRKARFDRFGRPLAPDSGKKKLERFYEEAEVEADDDLAVQKELDRVDRDDDEEPLSEESASENETTSSDEENEAEEDIEEVEFPATQGDVPMGEVSSRIAIVNLDWDNIRAADLMTVFSSFIPSNGRLLKVSVYPSEFGKERMEREEMEGPPKGIFATKPAASDDSSALEDEEEDDEQIKESILKGDKGEEFDSAKLRRYQLERLRYYYAVLECSSPTVAKFIYDAVDGTEYLSTANFFDLRFVPDETDFSEDAPRDECEKIPDGYKPNEFVTGALQHSKVKLTWDADDVTRKEAQAKAFRGGRKEIDENDLKAYLGSDTSEDEDRDAEVIDATSAVPGESTEKQAPKLSKKERERQRTRQLLGLGNEPLKKTKADGPVGDLQITFSSGLSSSRPSSSVFENQPEPEETTIEKYVRKERERKQKRKEKLKNSRASIEPDGIAKDAENDDVEGAKEDLGFDDPFFTEPDHDQAAIKARRKEEKRKKKEEREAEEAATAAQRAELELLMTDSKGAGGRHFNMEEIEKVEKKKGKKSKKGKKGAQPPEQADDFDVSELQDPRFAQLYESHEFAIDPNNPRFRKTPGMKALLEEGRKRRAEDEEDEGELFKKRKQG